MATFYRTILIHPGARSFTSAGFIVRFPISMMGIFTVLAVEEPYDSYTVTGLVSVTSFVTMTIGASILTRCVDRYGQSWVMLPAVPVSPLSLMELTVAAAVHAHLGILVVLPTLAGGLAGSMGSLVRVCWMAMLTRLRETHVTFPLGTVLDEMAFIPGPVLVTALCTALFLPVISGWVCCVAMQLVGRLWSLGQRVTEPVPHPTRPRRTAEATEQSDQTVIHPPVVRYDAMVSIAIVSLIPEALFEANDVTAVAFATEAGHKSASGLILAVRGMGSFSTALLCGSCTWGWPLWRQPIAGLVGLVVRVLTFGFAPSLVVLSVLALLTGLTITSILTSGNDIMQVTVAPSQLTEGLAWVSTALNIEVSIGSLLVGQVIDVNGSHVGYLAAAAFAWGAVVVGTLGLPALRRARTDDLLGGR